MSFLLVKSRGAPGTNSLIYERSIASLIVRYGIGIRDGGRCDGLTHAVDDERWMVAKKLFAPHRSKVLVEPLGGVFLAIIWANEMA